MAEIYDLFVSSYGEENEETIHWLRFNIDTNIFEKVHTVTGLKNPSYIRINHANTHLYAVSEGVEGEVVSYEIDYKAEKLIELNRQSTKGDPSFIEIDEKDRYLFTSNYEGGSIIVYPLKDGKIESHTDFQQFDSRRIKAYMHAIKNLPGTDLVVVSDQGHDNIRVFKHQDGKLHFQLDFLVADFTKPRQIAFKSDLNTMYVLNEEDSTLYVYNYDNYYEHFDLVQIVTTLFEPFFEKNNTGDLQVAGSFVFATNRGHNSVAVYEIKEDGRLDILESFSSGGEGPRTLAVLPNSKQLIVANEETNNLVVMDLLPNGMLEKREIEYDISRPASIQIVRRNE